MQKFVEFWSYLLDIIKNNEALFFFIICCGLAAGFGISWFIDTQNLVSTYPVNVVSIESAIIMSSIIAVITTVISLIILKAGGAYFPNNRTFANCLVLIVIITFLATALGFWLGIWLFEHASSLA